MALFIVKEIVLTLLLTIFKEGVAFLIPMSSS